MQPSMLAPMMLMWYISREYVNDNGVAEANVSDHVDIKIKLKEPQCNTNLKYLDLP
jgi:hypothetical protein